MGRGLGNETRGEQEWHEMANNKATRTDDQMQRQPGIRIDLLSAACSDHVQWVLPRRHIGRALTSIAMEGHDIRIGQYIVVICKGCCPSKWAYGRQKGYRSPPGVKSEFETFIAGGEERR